MSRSARLTLGLILLVWSDIVTPAAAADRYWGDTGGGLFHDGGNWQGPMPGIIDAAVFDLPGSAYTVKFGSSPTNQTLRVVSGDVAFDFDGHVYSTSIGDSGLNLIGDSSDADASLTLTNGRWNVGPDDWSAGPKDWIVVGNRQASTGDLTVAAGAVVEGSYALGVGASGDGWFTTRDGGIFLGYNATLGRNAGASGTALVTGEGSRWVSVQSLTIGLDGHGVLTIDNGGELQTGDASVAVRGGSGELIVRGTNSIFSSAAGLSLGGSRDAAGGVGTLTVQRGARATIAGRLQIWAGGTVELDGGWLAVGELGESAGQFNFRTGHVEFLGDLTADQQRLDAIWGPSHQVLPGQYLGVRGTLALASNLNVLGGTVEAEVLDIAPDTIAQVHSGGVSVGSSLTNRGWLRLFDETASIDAGDSATLTNSGLLLGSGRIRPTLSNQTSGQVRVAASEWLVLSGGTNNGLIDVNGGTVEFSERLVNNTANPSTGLIAARNATLRFGGGLTNSGSLVITGGATDVFGDVTNVANAPTTGRIIVSGGATANFYDDVANAGVIQVSAAGSLQSTAVFLGALTGNGVSGTGHVFIEGDTRPGFSPGLMTFGGDVTFGAVSTLTIELANAAVYDQVAIAKTATLGGSLDVQLTAGYAPTQSGQSFTLLTYASRVGQFNSVNLPALAAPGLAWTLTYGPTGLTLSTTAGVAGDLNGDGGVDRVDLAQAVFQSTPMSLANLADIQRHFGPRSLASPTAAVPEPNSGALLAIGIGTLIALRRVRQAQRRRK